MNDEDDALARCGLPLPQCKRTPVYCGTCGAQIDDLLSAPGVEPDMIAAYVCGDSLRIHRGNGCPANDGWRLGETVSP